MVLIDDVDKLYHISQHFDYLGCLTWGLRVERVGRRLPLARRLIKHNVDHVSFAFNDEYLSHSI
jgi:hypothetical protein